MGELSAALGRLNELSNLRSSIHLKRSDLKEKEAAYESTYSSLPLNVMLIWIRSLSKHGERLTAALGVGSPSEYRAALQTTVW
jgi:hypothetical protein